MTNCATYFDLRQKGYEPLSQPDLTAMRIEGATCQALEALEHARQPQVRSLRPFLLIQNTLARLPPTLGPAPNPSDVGRRARAAADGKAWAATDPDAILKSKGTWTAQVKSREWSVDLTVLGEGDFDADGLDNVLIETVSTGSEGSWSEVHLRLLTTAVSSPVLRVVKDYPL